MRGLLDRFVALGPLLNDLIDHVSYSSRNSLTAHPIPEFSIINKMIEKSRMIF